MNRISSFIRDQRGNIATMAILALPILIGGIAFGSEASYWLVEKTKLSFVTDAAALSAGQLYNRGKSETEIYNAIRANLVSKGYPDSTLALNIDYPTSTSDYLTANVSYRAEKYFSQSIWDGIINIRARTVVEINGHEACVLALNTAASGAVTMSGSSSIALTGCVVASNSSSPSSIYLGGSSTLTTDCMIASGGITGETHATTTCQKSRTYRRPTPDPFAGLVQPETPVSCPNPPNFNPTDTYTINPSCFRKDLNVKGTVTFTPGVYILDGADFTINSSAVVTGIDVTFVLKNGATLNFNGGATIDLRAPEAGSSEPYPGLLFWGSDTNGTSHKINGDASSYLSGAIYLPGDAVEFTGNSGMESSCTRIVGDTVSLLGNTDFSTNCTNQLAGYDIATADSVVIVE